MMQKNCCSVFVAYTIAYELNYFQGSDCQCPRRVSPKGYCDTCEPGRKIKTSSPSGVR